MTGRLLHGGGARLRQMTDWWTANGIPAAIALIAITVRHCTGDQARTLLGATALLWTATLALIITRS